MNLIQSRLLVKAALVAACLAAAMFVAGCNTMEGAGKDIEGAGEGIQDAAD